MGPSVLESQCLFCRDATSILSHFKTNPQLLSWDENCVKSFQEYLGLDESFQTLLTNAVYCSKCISIFRDIEFSLKSIRSLEKRLKTSRDHVEMLLQCNYDIIRSSISPSSDPDCSETKFNPYDHLVYLLCESLCILRPVDKLNVPSILETETEKRNELVIVSVSAPEPEESQASRKSSITIVPLSLLTDPLELESNKIIGRPSRACTNRTRRITANKVRGEQAIDYSDSEFNLDALEDHDPDFILPDIDTNAKSRQYLASKRKRMYPQRRYKSKSSEPKIKETSSSKLPRKRQLPGAPKEKKIRLKKVVAIPCSLCGIMIESKLKMRTHMAYHRNNDSKAAFRCESCNKKFLQAEEQEYEFHKELHQVKISQNKHFECVMMNCEKSFISNFDLKRHVMAEHDDTTHTKCDICGFVSNYNFLYQIL